MSNSTLVITLQSPRSVADLGRYIKASTDPRGEARDLRILFERIGAGLEAANFDVQTSAAAPARASGTITITNASVAAGNTVTVAGTALTAETSGATGAQFNIGGTATVTATNLAAAINANTKLVTATSSGGVVTVTCNAAGAVGNFVPLATSNSSGFGLSGSTLSGGAGGCETTAVNFSRGL